MAKKHDIGSRLKRVFAGAEFEKAVIINTGAKDSNFLYLSGFTSGVFEDSVLIADRKEMTLLTSVLEYDTAIEQAPSSMQVKCVNSGKEQWDEIRKAVGKDTIGLDYGFLPYGYAMALKKNLKNATFKDATEKFADAREIKDDYEISLMKKAVAITKESLKEIPAYFKNNMTEKELRARFEFLMGEKGGEGLAFDSIVSFGQNAALPHHMPDETRLKANEFVLLDVGARYQNYCADVTRTFLFEPDKSTMKYKRMEAIIDTVKEAQALGLSYVKDGADGMTAHNEVSKFIDNVRDGIYRGRFIHSLGHQVGIDVHDGTGLTTRSKILKKGMVVSDEPGIYITGFGGARFEDDVLVGKGHSSFL